MTDNMTDNMTDITTTPTLVSRIPELIAIVAGAIGFVFYIVTSVTGYLAGGGLGVWPTVCTVVALAALIVEVAMRRRLTDILDDVLLIGGEVLLIVGFALFVLSRVRLAADIYFIPVNYPASEQTAFNLSLIGVVFYLIAIIALIVKAFAAKSRVRPAITVVPATA